GRKAIDLKAAAIGEDRPPPAHEAMQPAQLGNQLIAGPQGEVVGVAEENLHADLFKLRGRESFDGGLVADGRENGRFDDTMGSGKPAAPRAAIGVQEVESKRHAPILADTPCRSGSNWIAPCGHPMRNPILAVSTQVLSSLKARFIAPKWRALQSNFLASS